jgi:membrane protein implicated in regulation of membrane protease activity
MPFIAKLEGLYLPVFMISFYMLLGAADGLIQPLFKKVKIHRIYLFVIILDLIQIGSYALAWSDMIVFTYAILSIFTLQAITFEISRVHTVDFMKDEIEIKEYLILRSFIVSTAIIAGALSAMILDYFDVKLSFTLIMLGILGIFAIVVEYKLYAKLKKIVQNGETIIERQKTLLNEKISL